MVLGIYMWELRVADRSLSYPYWLAWILAPEESEVGDIIAILFGCLLESRLDDTKAKEEL
jgi:hypothetical protein